MNTHHPLLSGGILFLSLYFSVGCAAPNPQAGPNPAPGSMPPSAVQLSTQELAVVGRKIWQNESGGTVAGLTSWNAGESFASLGIGHFIWYPAGQPGPFTESFPPLLNYFRANRVPLPTWLNQNQPCPWSTRATFQRDQSSPRMQDLRRLLSGTVELQTAFILDRLSRALPAMLAQTAPGDQPRVDANFRALAGSSQGAYALIDYVNFKGEGTSPTERYQGQGWGLLQVLQTMRAPTTGDFAEAAKSVLTRRVSLAPKNERQWLPGWLNRCNTYR